MDKYLQKSVNVRMSDFDIIAEALLGRRRRAHATQELRR